jgi:hypothetical protein
VARPHRLISSLLLFSLYLLYFLYIRPMESILLALYALLYASTKLVIADAIIVVIIIFYKI